MGRIIKQFKAQTGMGAAKSRGQIDSGTGQTVFNARFACRIGLDAHRPVDVEIYAAEGTCVVGFKFPVTITVGRRKATVEAFVPSHAGEAGRRRKVRVLTVPLEARQADEARLERSKCPRGSLVLATM